MLIPHGALVAVADAGGLVLYRNAGTEAAPELSPLPVPNLQPHSKDAGKRHRSSLANPQERLLEKDSFAAAIAEWLNKQAVEGKFDHFAIVAPAKFLGELRRNFHKTLEDKLVAEITKDLRERPLGQLVEELRLAAAA